MSVFNGNYNINEFVFASKLNKRIRSSSKWHRMQIEHNKTPIKAKSPI